MDNLSDKKIAFIICVNDADIFGECRYYLDRLELPDGFEKDMITITDAPSMAAGYNAGMRHSDAKYKVYMHQDVIIVNHNFIADLCSVFLSDSDIGILGCIGTTQLGKEAMAVTSWNTGKIMHNLIPLVMEFEDVQEDYTEVDALDGLLLATQYDIPWREDIMDGWDFYDISQCMEFARAGYKAVVPRQKTPWCYHDNTSSNMSKYNYYRRRFIDEYASDGKFEMSPESQVNKEYQELKQQSKNLMEQLIQAGDHEQLHKIFMDPANRKYIHLKEYEIIADIDYLEQQLGIVQKLWEPGMTVSEILHKVRLLKYWVKRIEYQAADAAKIMDSITEHYSVYAVIGIFSHYVVYQDYTFRMIEKYYEQEKMAENAHILRMAKEKLCNTV